MSAEPAHYSAALDYAEPPAWADEYHANGRPKRSIPFRRETCETCDGLGFVEGRRNCRRGCDCGGCFEKTRCPTCGDDGNDDTDSHFPKPTDDVEF